ncbi:11724_t:CDS:2, partial [Ambispora leptoticha]
NNIILSSSPNFAAPLISSLAAAAATTTFTLWWCTLQSNPIYAEDEKSRGNSHVIETIEDPDSKLHFPKRITLYDGASARLIGFGVRTLSFLKVKAYVVGLYVREQDIKVLRNWKDFDKEKFLSTGDESMAHALLDQPIEFAIRIVPMRDTNGAHLRDGFTRSLTNRIQYVDEELTGDDQSKIVDAIAEFKKIFPKTVVKKGNELIFTKQVDGCLRMAYHGKELGTIHNHWLAKNLLMGYLAAKSPISEKAKLSIAEGLEELFAADFVF